MDILMVIMVLIAVIAAGIASLLHRGRVRVWSLATIFLGLAAGLLLYRYIKLLQTWHTVLLATLSIVLVLACLYLVFVLRERRESRLNKRPVQDGSGVISTVPREAVNLSEWESVLIPEPRKKKPHRGRGAGTAPIAVSPLETDAQAQPEPPCAGDDVVEPSAAEAISLLFEENAKRSAVAQPATYAQTLPARPVEVALESVPQAESMQDDAPFENLRVRSVKLRPAGPVKPPAQDKTPRKVGRGTAAKDPVIRDVAESIMPWISSSFEDKADAKTTDIIDDASVTTRVSLPGAQVPVFDPAPMAEQMRDFEPEPVTEQTQAFELEPVAEEARGFEPEPVAEQVQDFDPEPVAEEAQDFEPESVAEPAQGFEPEPVAEEVQDFELEPVAEEVQDFEPEPIAEQARDFEPEPIAEQARDFEPEPVSDQAQAFNPEPVAEAPVVAPPLAEEAPFASGIKRLNGLIAARQYGEAQGYIFALLQSAYVPTQAEKQQLLLIMKLIKEKETRADANAQAR